MEFLTCVINKATRACSERTALTINELPTCITVKSEKK